MRLVSGYFDSKWPVIPSQRAAHTLAMLFQLEMTQWWPAAELLRCQLRQASEVVAHACRKVRFYRALYGAQERVPIRSAEEFSRLRVITRQDVQRAEDSIWSEGVPPHHQPVGRGFTSGSTGQPIESLTTTVTRGFWRVLTLREHLWHDRDFNGTLAVIREAKGADALSGTGKWATNWGTATAGVIETGRAALLSVQSSIEQQADWLARVDPTYLLSYPSVIRAIAEYCVDRGKRFPNLREVRTFGEIIEPECREAVRRAWDVPVVDVYSAQEVGYIALQCPVSEAYHVQSENLLVEVLRDDGSHCHVGEVGRVVLTTLHNFAMPLIRYELGDYAEVGGQCPCGRGLPVLRRILGRQRNMLLTPHGEKRWPSFGSAREGGGLPPFRQFQIVQRSMSQLELLIVRDAPLSPEEDARLREHLQKSLGFPFEIVVRRVAEIPRSPRGKYEEFRSEIVGAG